MTRTALFLLFLKPFLANTQLSAISTCLLKKEIYYEETDTCFPPLEQGPCPTDTWLVLDIISGKGMCRSRMECKDGAKPVLDPVAGAVCGCRNGKERFLGKCEALYTQSVCGDGWVLMPENVLLNSLECSSKFTSKEYEDCSSFEYNNPVF